MSYSEAYHIYWELGIGNWEEGSSIEHRVSGIRHWLLSQTNDSPKASGDDPTNSSIRKRGRSH